MMRRTVFLIGLLLASCATHKVWVKDGASDQDFEMERGQCQAQALSAPNPLNEGGVFNGCMRGKGWKIIKVPR